MDDARLGQFTEAVGVWLAEQAGTPRMAGRVLGWLLVSDPPEQTAAELATALSASKGSISDATQLLVQIRLIERLRLRGERSDRFRLRPEAWTERLRHDRSISSFRALLAEGLSALEGAPAARLRRLEELDAFYRWWEERLPLLWEEWQAHRSELA